MPVRWSSLFREIPWSGVLGAATSVAEAAKSAWSRMQKKETEPAKPGPALAQPGTDAAERIAALEIRLQALEKRNSELAQEAVASFEVVRSLTDQHSKVAGAVDALIERNRIVLRVCVLLAVAIVALFVFVVAR
jgi:hypothetical protein